MIPQVRIFSSFFHKKIKMTIGWGRFVAMAAKRPWLRSGHGVAADATAFFVFQNVGKMFLSFFVPDLGDHFGYNRLSFWAGRWPLIFFFFSIYISPKSSFPGLSINFKADWIIFKPSWEVFFLIRLGWFIIKSALRIISMGLQCRNGCVGMLMGLGGTNLFLSF